MTHATRGNPVLSKAAIALVGILAFCLAPPTFAQVTTCPAPTDTITQDSQLTQHMAAYPNCIVIDGDLRIGHGDCATPCDVTGFSPLVGVTTIMGGLSIQCCNHLTDISGFGSVSKILGDLRVYYNSELTTITGFPTLQSLQGSLSVSQNVKLLSIRGLTSLGVVGGYVAVQRNVALTSLDGLRQLSELNGEELLSGHALSVTYNTQLESLSGFENIRNISYGTVHIEGNTALCYAGYPVWRFDSFPLRPPSLEDSADRGIDWRTRLSGMEPWQFTWGVEGGGYPTLLIQNNAPSGSCGGATCHSSCPLNAGCLGPDNPALCGSCDLVGTFEPCVTTPTPGPGSNTGVIVGVVIVVLVIILVVLAGVGVWVGVVCHRKWKEGRMGSFDISLGGLESTDSADISKPTRGYSSKSKSSDLIASYSTPSQVTTPTYISSRNTSEDLSADTAVLLSHASPQHHTPRTGSSNTTGKGEGRRLPTKRHTSSTENLLSSRQGDEGEGPARSRGSVSGGSDESADVRKSSHDPGVEDMLQTLANMDFSSGQIKLIKKMGVGDFGEVLLAEAKKLVPGQKKTTVIVKQLKIGASPEERHAFLRPVEAMRILQHPNVLSLMGVVSKSPALQVMLEYCSHGNFKTFLITKRREAATLKENGVLLKMAVDMASGLHYLHTMSVAHNDFAVRSCLVTGEGTVKLGDYGITRQTFKEDYYARSSSQKAWPIRWMAPEQVMVEGKSAIDSLPVSMSANIWSFGISLWEVASFAQWPYDEMSNEEVIQTVIKSGKCDLDNPLKPSEPVAHLFDICRLCWQEPSLRPTMEEVLSMLNNPSLVARKKRNSSLKRQKIVNLPPSRSHTISSQPRGQSANPPQGNINLTSQARRPAPVNPPPGRRPAPVNPLPGRRPAPVNPPPGNGNTLPRAKRPAPVRPGSGGQAVKQALVTARTAPSPAPTPAEAWKPTGPAGKEVGVSSVRRSPETHARGGSHQSDQNGIMLINSRPLSEVEIDSRQPDQNGIMLINSRPLSEVEIDAPASVGGAKFEGAHNDETSEEEEEEMVGEFILDPPDDFSQSSFDTVDNDETPLPKDTPLPVDMPLPAGTPLPADTYNTGENLSDGFTIPFRPPEYSESEESEPPHHQTSHQKKPGVSYGDGDDDDESDTGGGNGVVLLSHYHRGIEAGGHDQRHEASDEDDDDDDDDDDDEVRTGGMSLLSRHHRGVEAYLNIPPNQHQHHDDDDDDDDDDGSQTGMGNGVVLLSHQQSGAGLDVIPNQQRQVSDEEPAGGRDVNVPPPHPPHEHTPPQEQDAEKRRRRRRSNGEDGTKKKSKKKHRHSRDLESTGKHHSSKHKSKKRRSASSEDLLSRERDHNDEIRLPEYEFDRGLDRVPMGTSREKPSSYDGGRSSGHRRRDPVTSEQLPSHDRGRGTGDRGGRGPAHHKAKRDPVAVRNPQFDLAEREELSSKGHLTKKKLSSSYENVMADEEFRPPWLEEEPATGDASQTDELDEYESADPDAPRVMYSDDVAALIW